MLSVYLRTAGSLVTICASIMFTPTTLTWLTIRNFILLGAAVQCTWCASIPATTVNLNTLNKITPFDVWTLGCHGFVVIALIELILVFLIRKCKLIKGQSLAENVDPIWVEEAMRVFYPIGVSAFVGVYFIAYYALRG